MHEELGVEVSSSKMLGVYSDPARSPEKHVVALLYKVDFAGTPRVLDRDEIIEGGFYDPRTLPERLAFDHSKMLNDYLAGKSG